MNSYITHTKKLYIVPCFLFLVNSMCWGMQQCLDDTNHILYAASHNNLPIVIYALSHGSNPNYQNSLGHSPLDCAATCGATTIVQFLLKNGANPLLRDCKGLTPLHSASFYGHTDIVTLLLAASKENINWVAFYGLAPLHVAISQRHQDVAEILIRAGAQFNIHSNYKNLTPIEAAQQCGLPALASFMASWVAAHP